MTRPKRAELVDRALPIYMDCPRATLAMWLVLWQQRYTAAVLGARKCRDNAARYKRERDEARQLAVDLWDAARHTYDIDAGDELYGFHVAVAAMRERQGR